MSALFTESGCPLELLLPTTSSTCKCKKTYITRLLRELNVLKVGQNREISSFLRFLRFLTNFIIMYYGQHWRILWGGAGGCAPPQLHSCTPPNMFCTPPTFTCTPPTFLLLIPETIVC